MKILILGGTGEARALANELVRLGHEVITSLAGRTQDPKLPLGQVRIGGFGGVSGLVAYLQTTNIERLIDATHPYAEQMSRHAVAAAEACGIPLMRYTRPPWQQAPGAQWLMVQTAAEAAAALPSSAHVLLTTGHTALDIFLARRDCRFIVRTIEAPAIAMPRHATLLQSRPPYHLHDEIDLMQREGITHLVAKNSGGGQTAAKLEAAQNLGITIIMIARPTYGPAREAETVAATIAALGLAD